MKTVVVSNIKRADAAVVKQQRRADEKGKRKQLAAGAPGLDMYNMREPLKKAGLIYLDEPLSD